MLATLAVLASIVACFCAADAKRIGIPYAATSSRPVAFFVPRGGSADEGGEPSPELQPLVGIVDLRPEPGPDRILGDNQRAVFSAAHQDDDDNSLVDEQFMDQHAASSHTIGQLCPTVYLLVAYDFDNGKTALHRSLGGTKLMAFIDGVRGRRHETAGATPTRLVLVLVPSANSSMPLVDEDGFAVLDPVKDSDDEWDASGAKFLVDRLSEAFALGGEEYQTMVAFDVAMIGACADYAKEENADVSSGDVDAVVLKHLGRALTINQEDGASSDAWAQTDAFQDLIAHAYCSAGGAEKIDFR